MWRKWRVRVCLRWTKCAEMLKNAIAYAEICDYMWIFANLCINKNSKYINKYSKFWKFHYMWENMRYAHFLQNMRNMLWSHDRYKPVSLIIRFLYPLCILCVKSVVWKCRTGIWQTYIFESYILGAPFLALAVVIFNCCIICNTYSVPKKGSLTLNVTRTNIIRFW